MSSFSKNNRYRIADEKWTIDIASLWKFTIVEVYYNDYNNYNDYRDSELDLDWERFSDLVTLLLTNCKTWIMTLRSSDLQWELDSIRNLAMFGN